MRNLLFALVALLSFVALSAADDSCPNCRKAPPVRQHVQATARTVHEALAEVNAARARRGLRPFVYDEGLTRAATGCAKLRAERLIEGHFRDFSALPPGYDVNRVVAGCGAATDDWGWQTCCTYENYRFAGTAWCRGRDGQRYMHIFVRR